MNRTVLGLVLSAAAVLATEPTAVAQAIERIDPSGPAPHLFLEGVALPSDSEVLMLSGKTAALPSRPDEPVTAKVTAAQLGSTEVQAESVLARIKMALERRGWAMSDVVKITIYLVGDPANNGRMDFAGMNAAYRRFFGSGGNPNLPARTTVQVVALAQPAYLVEIDAVAARAPKRH